jgi:hypothetical protein
MKIYQYFSNNFLTFKLQLQSKIYYFYQKSRNFYDFMGTEEMCIRSALYRARSLIAKIFGISAREARDGSWWETDFILAILLGALLLGISAWL